MGKVIHIISDQNITVNYDGETHIVPRIDALAEKLIQALREGKADEIPGLVSAAKRIEKFSDGNFIVKDGVVMINGIAAPPVLSEKIIKFSNEGLPYLPLVKFAERLALNPSFRAVNELYGFLEKNDHPICENGAFIAYKRVRGDFKDLYTGTMDNSVGAIVEMPRNQVNEDCTQTCSNGLHCANWSYSHTQYGNTAPDTTDIMVEVEVGPEDVVSVPIDYDNAKMRVCRYKVNCVVKTPFDPKEYLRQTEKGPNPIQYAPCCLDGECECPEGCGCICDNGECYSCPDNELNSDRLCDCGQLDCDNDCCENCGAPKYYGELDCECDLEETNSCSGCPGSCDQTKTTEEPYPYEDEMDED